MKTTPTIAEVAARAQAGLQNLTVADLTALKRYQALQAQMRETIQEALGDRHLYTREQMAELFDVTVRTVERWASRGWVPKPSARRWDIREVVKLLITRLEAKEAGGHLTPTDRYRLAKAQREEIKLDHERGLLVKREAIIRSAGPALSALRGSVLGLPERIMHYVPDDQRAAVRADLREICDSHLRELQEALLTHGDSGSTGDIASD